MVGRHRGDEEFPGQRDRGEPRAGRSGHRPADESGVDVPLDQCLHLGGAGHFPGVQVDVGVLAAERGECFGQHPAQRGAQEADGQPAGLAAPGTGRFQRGEVEVAQHLLGAPQERPARGGGVHAVPGAVEEPHAQLGLQVLDLLGQRRLRDAERGGGPAEVRVFGQGQRVAQVSKLHQPTLSISTYDVIQRDI